MIIGNREEIFSDDNIDFLFEELKANEDDETVDTNQISHIFDFELKSILDDSNSGRGKEIPYDANVEKVIKDFTNERFVDQITFM